MTSDVPGYAGDAICDLFELFDIYGDDGESLPRRIRAMPEAGPAMRRNLAALRDLLNEALTDDA